MMSSGDLTHADYITYLQEALNIMCKHPKRGDLVGDHLTVLSWGPMKVPFGDFATTVAQRTTMN
jgi:hypothetical protein